MEDRKVIVVDHHSHYHLCNMRCLSWSAIFFGALVALALSFLTNLFSLAVGLTAFPVTPEGKEQLATWGFVGLTILGIVTMFISGWIAGFLGRTHCYKRKLGELYGFGAWSLALVLALFLTTQTNQFLSQRTFLVSRNLTPIQLTNEITQSTNQISALANKNTAPSTQTASTVLGVATFATFFILFVGALSATFGGRLGMRYNKQFKPEECPTCK